MSRSMKHNSPNLQSKILIISGEGGHAAQAMVLAKLLSEADETRQYLTAIEDSASGKDADLKLLNMSQYLKRYSKKSHYFVISPLLIKAFFQFLKITTHVKPQAIISLGPYISVYALIYCKLVGAKFLHIETRARFKSLSLTYRCVKFLGGATAYQNLELRTLDPDGLYFGRLE